MLANIKNIVNKDGWKHSLKRQTGKYGSGNKNINQGGKERQKHESYGYCQKYAQKRIFQKLKRS